MQLIQKIVILGLLVTVTACGTILHPERKGQISGRIDPGVAVLNGIGLLLYIIPGVVAFAVDYANGTIYLPPSESSSIDRDAELEQYVQIKVAPEALTHSAIARVVAQGAAVDLAEHSAIETYRVLADGRRVKLDQGRSRPR